MKAFINNVTESTFNNRAKSLILNYGRKYFENAEMYDAFINTILVDEDLDLYGRALLAYDIKEHNLNARNEDYKYVEGTDLTGVISDLFRKYLLAKTGYDIHVLNFFLLNTIKKGSAIPAGFEHDACKSLRVFLGEKQNLSNFINYCIRSYSLPNNNYFCLEPITPDVFNSWSEFQRVVEKYQSTNDHEKKLIKIIENAIPKFESGGNRFTVNYEEKQWLLDHLRQTGQYK